MVSQSLAMTFEYIRNNKNILDQVVKLGTKNSKTLGHFPQGAFVEHAHRGNILCAIEKDKLLGYVLFAVTQRKQTIRIVHLCISESSRGKGIAKQLLDRIREKFKDSLKGIQLSCRYDYLEASELWKKYGFVAADKVRSRSIKENYLVKWWYDFGNHDLFSLSDASSDKVKALLDANIIIKIRDQQKGKPTDAQFLLEDHLVDSIDYYYAPEFFNEILRDNDNNRANDTRSFIRSNFCQAKFDPSGRDSILDKLNETIPGNSVNDQSDKKQLAECIAGGIPYFITNDKGILDADHTLNSEFGIEVMRPVDFIIAIDESNNYVNYRSTRIAGVNYEYSKLKPKEVDTLVELFLNRSRSERKHEFRNTLISLATKISSCEIKLVRDRETRILGLSALEVYGDTVKIQVLRTTNTNLSKTLFNQLILEAVNYTRSQKLGHISIHESNISNDNLGTLESYGFIKKGEEWSKVSLEGIRESATIFDHELIKSTFDIQVISKKYYKSGVSEEYKSGVERMFWPVKFIDLDLPSYIIPIKPFWASQLFDYYAAESSLFGSSAELSWSRENVYYRSVKPVTEKAPGRLLWYSSSAKNQSRTNAIVGCSYLDEVHIGEAKKQFQRFRNYGIYQWDDIYKLAKYNIHTLIKVLKFSDTEVFKEPIKLIQINKVLLSHGQKKNTFPSPVKISNETFMDLYKIGTQN